NFEQTSSGALEFLLGGDMSGEYGALNVSGRVTLDGELELATTGGFHWTGGDTFDLMTYSPDGGSFNGVSFGGVACTATLTTVWDCGGGFNLDLIVGTNGVEATILSIPEPSTWAMLATGFAGLGFAGYRASRRTAVSVWTNRRAPREP
ncbi:MAG TPA: PEP-CTERM sorting domain-containing protein, partial [Methylocystis sp.]|nr:PEP-CTERM sorting domain-containing protein [Methylocystis sp.]